MKLGIVPRHPFPPKEDAFGGRGRGYPAAYMPAVSYDTERRERLMKTIYNRPFCPRRKHDGGIIALKVAYSPQLAKVGIRAAYMQLLRRLRREIGDTFLQKERLVIAYPTRGPRYSRSIIPSISQRQENPLSTHEERCGVGFFRRSHRSNDNRACPPHRTLTFQRGVLFCVIQEQ